MQNLILGDKIFSQVIAIVLIESFLYFLLGSVIIQIVIHIIGYFGHFVCLALTIPGQNIIRKWYDLLELNNEQVVETLKRARGVAQTDLKNQNQVVQDLFERRRKFLQRQEYILSNVNYKNRLQQQYFSLLSNKQQLLQKNNLSIDEKEEIKELCQKIYIFLDKNQNVNSKTIWNLFSQKLFTFEQRRTEIFINNERFQVFNKKTKSKLDCMFILTNKKSNKAVLFCNSNSMTYESQYFESDWFKFYQNNGFNVVAWNYCGYGESTGKPTLENFINDGNYVAEYFQKVKQFQIFGVHGTSLGGMIASEIAKKFKFSFLIVDRTFSSTGQVVQVRFGKFCRVIYNFLLPGWDRPNYQSFYQFNGPKLLIQNANDVIIPYAAQAQTSMVRCYFKYPKEEYTFLDSFNMYESQLYLNFFYEKICSKQDATKLCIQLNYIFSLENNLDQRKLDEYQIQQFRQDFDDLKKIFKILNYNGNNFWYVMESSANEEKVALFFGSCFTYGQQDDNYEFDRSFDSFKLKLNEFQKLNQNKISLNYVSNVISNIVEEFKKYKMNELDTSQKFRLGELVTVRSEHNSNLAQDEKMKVQQFISKHNFQ